MKILFHHRIASKDGQYVHIEELYCALKSLGHEVILVGPPIEGGVGPRLRNRIPRSVYELLELAYSVIVFSRLRRAIRKHRPDCIYERYNLFMPAGIWASKLFGLPLLLEVNAPIYEERSRYGGISLKILAVWSEGFTWRGADRVLVVSQVLGDRVRDRGVEPGSIVVIPNGVDLQKFAHLPDVRAAKRRLGISEDRLVLGFVGYMREWHGLEGVVDLIAEDEGARLNLLVVGDGPARAIIEARARERKVSDRVTFTGVVARDQVADYIAAFDIALQPDVVDYASPLKLFEYMAAGRAIVAPDKANIREVLVDGGNALLFDPYDQGTFAAAVRALCRNEALRIRIGDAARQTIIDGQYTWHGNAIRVEKLFNELLGGSLARAEQARQP